LSEINDGNGLLVTADERPRDENWHELKQRAEHLQAEPADSGDVDDNESLRRQERSRRKAEASRHQRLRADEECKRGDKVSVAPTTAGLLSEAGAGR
jgi:hypothetical protein